MNANDAVNIQDVLEGRARWCVVRADCRDVLAALPDSSVAHVITDPPYSDHVHGLQRRMLRGAGGRSGRVAKGQVGYAPLGFDSLGAELREFCAAQFGRLALRWVLAFCDVESQHLWQRDLSAHRVRHIRVGAWVKVNGQPQLSGDRPAVGFEAIEIAHGAAKCSWNGGGLPAVWAFAVATDRNGERVHTTQKPLDLMLKLVKQFTDPGDLVLDPFCGSGTTGVAALRLGRRFLGVEMQEQYAQVARERLAAEARGLSRTEALAGQTSIFDALEKRLDQVEKSQAGLTKQHAVSLAERLGRRLAPTRTKATKAAPKANATSAEKIARMRKLRAEGLSLEVIAERLGVHLNTVAKHLARAHEAVQKKHCACGRPLRGDDERCYICRGYRTNARRSDEIARYMHAVGEQGTARREGGSAPKKF